MFVLLEGGLYIALCWGQTPFERDGLRPVWWAACAMLVLLPIYHFGYFNDLVMRSSTPALYILLIGVVGCLRKECQPGKWGWRVQTLIMVCCLGGLTGLSEVTRVLHRPIAAPTDWHREGLEAVGGGVDRVILHGGTEELGPLLVAAALQNREECIL